MYLFRNFKNTDMKKRNLLLAIALLFLGTSIYAQDISSTAISALQKGNASELEEVFGGQDFNKCFELKGNVYNYLALSVRLESLASLKFFVEKGADLEQACTSKTPLMYAVKYGQLDMVKYLVDNGAKLETKTAKGNTALDYAKKYKHAAIEAYIAEKLKG